MEDQYELLYSTPHHLCSCRDKYNKLTSISKNYKRFFEGLKDGKEGYEVLNDMKIFRMCCRSRFLSIPTEHMIDRTKDRYFNHEKINVVRHGTRELQPGVEPPNFPLLPI